MDVIGSTNYTWIIYSTLNGFPATLCTAGFNYRNSAFCPRSVFVCFVWISEQSLFHNTTLSDWMLGAFTELRKATVRFVPSVRVLGTVWFQPDRFYEIWRVIIRIFVEKIQLPSVLTRITVHYTKTSMHLWTYRVHNLMFFWPCIIV